jgi:hypothetical protein
MAGLVPAIHVFPPPKSAVPSANRSVRVDGRDKPGQDAVDIFRQVTLIEPWY